MRRAVLLLLVCLALAPSNASAQQVAALDKDAGKSKAGGASAATTNAAPERTPQTRRIASVRTRETAEGSRVTLTSDTELGDYSAYRSGDRFVVQIPQADAGGASALVNALRGSGFEDAQVERRGRDLLLSFKLAAGATANVKQSFNRLEINFASQDKQQQQTGGSSAPPRDATPATSPSPAPSPSPGTSGAQPATTDSPVGPPVTTSSDSSTVTETVGAAKVSAGKSGSITLPPEKVGPIHVPRLDTPPVIDGKLDDAVWKQARVLKDFYQTEPGDNIAPSKPTEAFIGYDSKHLYIAFHAFDEPSKVRANVAKRDAIFDDDYVVVFLDTFNDQRKAIEIDFNPLGIQADAIFTEGSGEDFSFDLVMESKGMLMEDGWTVEVAIPFKSLRYEAGKDKLWGAHFFRRIKRFNNELDSWMPLSRDISGNLIQAGKLTGLEGISTERTLEIIPSITFSQEGKRVRSMPQPPFGAAALRARESDPGHFENKGFDYDFGVTTKFGITPTVTLDFAYNPDFAQVEADQTVVLANQRFPIFFQEKRPFFLEGKEIFDTSSNIVHTRAIVDPDYAVKLTGKRGRNTFGLILASDNGPGNFTEEEREDKRIEIESLRTPDPKLTAEQFAEQLAEADRIESRFNRFLDKNASIGVLRLKRDVGRESSIGMIATSYNFVEKHNQVLGLDGRFKLNPKTIAGFEVIGTNSKNFFRDLASDVTSYRNRNGFGYSYILDYTGRYFGYVFEG
ncbi:MAG TPA: DUF5916 domain-containing protein, partial [Pyrinomonadaceae bacterium]|nr:DUF5916 domain-containing protein [Pyrinomonadaceae bacterium]